MKKYKFGIYTLLFRYNYFHLDIDTTTTKYSYIGTSLTASALIAISENKITKETLEPNDKTESVKNSLRDIFISYGGVLKHANGWRVPKENQTACIDSIIGLITMLRLSNG